MKKINRKRVAAFCIGLSMLVVLLVVVRDLPNQRRRAELLEQMVVVSSSADEPKDQKSKKSEDLSSFAEPKSNSSETSVTMAEPSDSAVPETTEALSTAWEGWLFEIPSLGIREPLLDNDEDSTLLYALGLVTDIEPGENGNCMIAGHRDYPSGRFFNKLPNIALGAEITISDGNTVYRYHVASMDTILPENTECLEPTDTEKLTLITCTPIFIGTHRFVVVALPEEFDQSEKK